MWIKYQNKSVLKIQDFKARLYKDRLNKNQVQIKNWGCEFFALYKRELGLHL